MAKSRSSPTSIFYGSSGNGKTLTAKVLARELGLPFYETKLSDVASPYIHDVSKNIRSMAKQLNDKYEKTGEMSVWFLDEFDSLGEARDGQTASHKQEVTNTLLQELNNPSSKGYILIAAILFLSSLSLCSISVPNLVRRIGTLNCGHSAYPIIMDVSSQQYTPERPL